MSSYTADPILLSVLDSHTRVRPAVYRHKAGAIIRLTDAGAFERGEEVPTFRESQAPRKADCYSELRDNHYRTVAPADRSDWFHFEIWIRSPNKDAVRHRVYIPRGTRNRTQLYNLVERKLPSKLLEAPRPVMRTKADYLEAVRAIRVSGLVEPDECFIESIRWQYYERVETTTIEYSALTRAPFFYRSETEWHLGDDGYHSEVSVSAQPDAKHTIPVNVRRDFYIPAERVRMPDGTKVNLSSGGYYYEDRITALLEANNVKYSVISKYILEIEKKGDVRTEVERFYQPARHREAIAGLSSLAELKEGRSAFKEALVMEVFKPERVERMIEKYGLDWLERV